MKEPVRHSWPSVEPKEARPPRVTRSGMFTKQHVVLIVDDRADNRELCRECLTMAGFHVIEAADGAVAVKLATAALPDVIVMDVAMPVMDGYEASRRLKEDARTKHIPIVLLTATPLGAAAHAEDRDALLLKPCSIDELESEVRKWAIIGHDRNTRAKTTERKV